MEYKYANVNGITLHYATEGEGKLILFLHGFPEFWYAWKELLAEFGQDYQAVAPDMRGYNLSSRPAEVAEYKPKVLMEDIRQLIEHLGHRRCILVAHDWGGAIGWGFAMAFPQYVERLVIINSPHPVPFARELTNNPAQQQASAYMNFFRTSAAETLLAADDHKWLLKMTRGWGGDVWMSDADTAAYRAAWSQPGALTGGLNYYRASPLHPPDNKNDSGPAHVLDNTERFKVAVPTLVIWGLRDSALLPCLLDGLEDYVADLTIHRMPEASHWVVHEKAAEVAATIRHFIAG